MRLPAPSACPRTGALPSHLGYEEQQITGPLARHGFYRGQV
jgi:hypothetical protein